MFRQGFWETVTDGDLTIKKRQGVIGPDHDPYSMETLQVIHGPHSAEWYSDGLGRDQLRLYEGDILSREVNWFSMSNDRESRLTSFKCRLLFKQWVGIASDDADAKFEDVMARSEPDPMGHPSMYE